EGAQDYARPIDHDPVPFRSGRGCSAKLSSGWTRNLLLLPDRLSEARRTGSGESNISFAFEVTEFKCQQMPSRDFVTFAAACNEAHVILGGCAEAVAMSPFGTNLPQLGGQSMSALPG